MKTNLSNYPLLTPDDILILRGKPVAKRIEQTGKNPLSLSEEWVYYHINSNTAELFTFKDGQLITYEEETPLKNGLIK
jgi:hypothetical protein